MMSERMKEMDAPHPPFELGLLLPCGSRKPDVRLRGGAAPVLIPSNGPAKRRAASGRKAVVYFAGAVEN